VQPAVDARVARTHATVLRTATDLLVEGGPSAVTIDAIVTRSGVAKSTIYRHWDTRDDVLVAVIERCAPRIEPPDEALDFEAALRSLTAELRRVLNDPDWARVLPALITLRSQNHGVADLEQRIEQRQEHVIEDVLQRGVAEGRLAAGFDVDHATALLVGPLVFAVLMGKPEVDEPFCDHVVDAFLRTSTPSPDDVAP
jgi:AcrR family transcriptional regulator